MSRCVNGGEKQTTKMWKINPSDCLVDVSSHWTVSWLCVLLFCQETLITSPLSAAAEEDDDEDELDEEDESLLRKTGNYVVSSDSLPSGILRVSRFEGCYK